MPETGNLHEHDLRKTLEAYIGIYMSFVNWRKQCFVQYSTETMIEKKLTWTWLGARIFVSFHSYPDKLYSYSNIAIVIISMGLKQYFPLPVS